MSKMKELDIASQAVADQLGASIIVGLRQEGYIKDPCDDSLRLDVDRAAAIFVTKLLRGEHDDCDGHDWIGEALCRREECAALIEQVGELQADNDQLRAACERGAESELRTRDAAQRAGWPAPSEGMTATDNTEPLNGYIVVYPDHPDAGHMIVNKLSEYEYIRGMDGDGTIITDVEDEIAVCYELDAQVMPVRSVRWEEV